MSVVVITDTTASLGAELATRWGVRLVPLTVTVAGRAFLDNELDASTLTGARVTTSGPPPGEFLAALRATPDGAVIVTVAASLSSTNSAARLAAAEAATEHNVPVEVVDGMSAVGGQALVVRAAADRAAEGADVHEVARAARIAAREVRLVGCLDSLEGLARSGRVPGIVALAARKAGLQFIFMLRDGSIKPVRPAGSNGAALDRMVDMCVSLQVDPGRSRMWSSSATPPASMSGSSARSTWDG